MAFSDSARGVSATYAYDAFGRRVARHVTGSGAADTRYYYGNASVVEEQDASGATQATYVYGQGMDTRLSMRRGGQNYFYHADDLQNVLKVTDAAGQVVEQYAYGDYGAPEVRDGAGALRAQSAIGNPYLFTGREYDPESGLYYYRTRHLDPRAGRFVSRDSIGAWGDPLNLGNAQTYVGNNPWTLTDPMGQDAMDFTAGLGGGAMSFGGDVLQAAVNAPFEAVQQGYNFVRDPAGSVKGTWNGLSATMTKVACHPDGISAGYAQLLFPDAMRKGHCWYFISDYERGHALGKAGAQIIVTAVSYPAAVRGAVASGMKFLRVSGLHRLHGQMTHTRLGVYRSRGGYEKYGMSTARERQAFKDVARLSGRDLHVGGSLSETRLGFQRRYDPKQRQHFLDNENISWRGKKPESGLVNEGDPDLDLWEEPGMSHAEKRFVVEALEQRLPEYKGKIDFGYSATRYPKSEVFGSKCGALVFPAEGASYRIMGVHQGAAWPGAK